jgi:hypothetical protein
MIVGYVMEEAFVERQSVLGRGQDGSRTKRAIVRSFPTGSDAGDLDGQALRVLRRLDTQGDGNGCGVPNPVHTSGTSRFAGGTRC